MLALFLVFLFAFILLSLITHIYYSFLFLHPTLKLTCGLEIEELLTHLAVKRQVSASDTESGDQRRSLPVQEYSTQRAR